MGWSSDLYKICHWLVCSLRLCYCLVIPDLEVIKLEFILRLKIKRNDWLLADTCPQAANHCALFCGHMPASSQSLCFILTGSVSMYLPRGSVDRSVDCVCGFFLVILT